MSTIRNLLPLFILFVIVAVGGYIGYQFYLWSNQLADRSRKSMEKRNVTFTKDGMKVGVKQVSEEELAAKQQSYLVKAWNLSSLPAYKSRFWNLDEQAKQKELAKQAKSASAQPRATNGQVKATSASVGSAPAPAARPAARTAGSSVGAFPE